MTGKGIKKRLVHHRDRGDRSLIFKKNQRPVPPVVQNEAEQFSTISPQYQKTLSKLEHEKTMKERAKKLWYSIVSVPMGGMKK